MKLKNNNTSLEALLTTINELPEIKEPVLQDKTVSPSTSSQSVKPDAGYDGLSQVTVNAMPTATQATPSISVSSAGVITASATQSAGYVSAGTKSATKQLTTQAAKTITPSTSSQTAVTAGKYTTGAVTVAAIPSNYEDVATETSAYTTKLSQLETAITALEQELEGKAAGGEEDLSAELAEYSSLNTELESVINSLPNAEGGSSNGEIKTCTVEIVADLMCTDVFSFIRYNKENNEFYAEDIIGSGTLENVVCNSLTYVIGDALVTSLDGSSYYDRFGVHIGNTDTIITYNG